MFQLQTVGVKPSIKLTSPDKSAPRSATTTDISAVWVVTDSSSTGRFASDNISGLQAKQELGEAS